VETIAAQTGGKPIEIWFAEEGRIGQKNKITRRSAKPAHRTINEPRRPISS
jgi:hypothetical protein